jgi:hypothetical protein
MLTAIPPEQIGRMLSGKSDAIDTSARRAPCGYFGLTTAPTITMRGPNDGTGT